MKRAFLLLCLPFLVMAACSKQPVVPPQEDILYQLEDVFPKNPDSVLQILDTLNVVVLSEKERAHYCLLKFNVCEAFPRFDDEIDSLLQVAEDYFVGSNEKYFEAKTCEALAYLASKRGKGEQVHLEWLLKALQNIEQCHHVDERLIRYSNKSMTEQDMIDFKKYGLYIKLGMCYLGNHYSEESLVHLRKAALYFENTKSPFMRFQSATMLGNAYLENKEYDSCLLWYGKAREVAEKSGKTEQIAYSHFSMSTYFTIRHENQDYKNEKEGEQLLRQSISECLQGLTLYKGQMFLYKDGLYNDLTNSYFQLEQYDSCLYYSEKLLAFQEEHGSGIVPSKWSANLYRLMYQSHNALGHTEEALKYAQLYCEMQQAIDDQPKAVEQVKSEYDKKLEMQQLQAEQQTRRLRLYLLLSLLVAVLAIVLVLVYRYRKEKEIESLKAQEAYMRLQSDLEASEQHSLQVLQQRAMGIYQSGGDNILERILVEFETDRPKVIKQLKEKYPMLNDTECHIIVLSFLGFRVKEMAEILDLSPNTVTKYRTNIRQKVGSDHIADLIG